MPRLRLSCLDKCVSSSAFQSGSFWGSPLMLTASLITASHPGLLRGSTGCKTSDFFFFLWKYRRPLSSFESGLNGAFFGSTEHSSFGTRTQPKTFPMADSWSVSFPWNSQRQTPSQEKYPGSSAQSAEPLSGSQEDIFSSGRKRSSRRPTSTQLTFPFACSQLGTGHPLPLCPSQHCSLAHMLPLGSLHWHWNPLWPLKHFSCLANPAQTP